MPVLLTCKGLNFPGMAATAAYITQSAGSKVLGIQENIKSDNQMMIEAQAIFDDVYAIESPKKVV